MGSRMMDNLASLMDRHAASGDIRGKGLFCGAELVAEVQEACFWHLKAPILRVAGWDAPYPHAQEWDYFVSPARIAHALRSVLED
jgi:pyruvate/2-oxoglutarate/acetoin dehydrogenase E1 component